ncbi:MAG: DUF58 domain-containing protein [Lachnospiraceae bacterium]|nr:DUF58 domain-containing protein [Lachnospiraceae bacterium]
MSDLFDAGFFTKLNQLKLAAHIRLDQGQSGARKSSARGSSVEFSDFREYLPGDDIRRIDWNVYGRLDKLYVKQFMEEKEAKYHIFLDTSASMAYGEEEKSVMALRLSAVLTWIVLQQLDRVEVLTFRDGRLGHTSPIVGRGSFQRLLRDLEQVEFGGTTGLHEAVRRSSTGGKGISILISDFFEEDGLEEAVRFLVYQRQEVCLIQVLAREEIEFDGEGTYELVDLERAGSVRVTMSRQSIRMYREALKRHQERLMRLAKRYGCTFLQVVSDEPLEKIVFETLRQKGLFG